MQVQSVPFFIYNETLTDGGAPEPDWLEHLFTWMIEGGDYTPRFLPNSMKEAGKAVIPANETRIMPLDNAVYTWKQFVETYSIPAGGGHNTLTDLTFFWADRMPEVSLLPGLPPLLGDSKL